MVTNNINNETPPNGSPYEPECESQLQGLLKFVAAEEIPSSADLFSAEMLEEYLCSVGDPPLSLVTVGDIMLGARARRRIQEHGIDYPFSAVLPILRRAPIVVGNLEGPLARKAQKQDRTFSYRAKPTIAKYLIRAGINVVTLANNHLTDCGREGILETLQALATAGVKPLGAAANASAAHRPVILEAAGLQIGLLSYYWNRRCAATATLPGGAMGQFDELEADICALRKQVDRLVVMFHWGRPYKLDPSPRARAKAHVAVDCGADAVVGHHPHILQAFEIYRNCPIFYSVGNFAFGSGNSKAEGLLLGFRFEGTKTVVNIYPLYVKNRDPRVNYQPKVLRGDAVERKLRYLAALSGRNGAFLQIEQGRGKLELPCRAATSTMRGKTVA